MQLTLGDAGGLGNRTRREIFLAEMAQVVLWAAQLTLIGPATGSWAGPPAVAVRSGDDEPVDGASAVVAGGGQGASKRTENGASAVKLTSLRRSDAKVKALEHVVQQLSDAVHTARSDVWR